MPSLGAGGGGVTDAIRAAPAVGATGAITGEVVGEVAGVGALAIGAITGAVVTAVGGGAVTGTGTGPLGGGGGGGTMLFTVAGTVPLVAGCISVVERRRPH